MRAIHGNAKIASARDQKNQSDTESQQQVPQEEDDEDTPVEDADDNDQEEDLQTDEDNGGRAETPEASESSSEVVSDYCIARELRN